MNSGMHPPVLIVDDDPAIRMVVHSHLRRSGYDARQADSGSACLDQVRLGFRGIILMDITMPGLDGWSVIRTLVDEGLERGNVFCMLTGQHDPGPESDGLQEYIFDYVTKPFSDTTLQTVVDQAEACLSG